jgi:hypothetical protein
LRLRAVDVLTVQEDGRSGATDSEVLDRATELGRVLFSRDVDLLIEAQVRQTAGEEFAGVIYAHQLRVSIGECVRDLELCANASKLDEWTSRVEYLPL